MVKRIPPIYLLLYSALKARNRPYMIKHEVDVCIKEYLKVNNTMRLIILEEMEELGLVKKINQREWRIMEGSWDKELDHYKKYGRWVSSIPE